MKTRSEAGGSAARLSVARELALAVLLEAAAGRPANEALERALERSRLDERDRALTTALVDGTLRWQGRLDHVLGHFSKHPLSQLPAPILAALRLGAFQLLFLERVPPCAAVDESVRLAHRFGHLGTARLVNAVLRRVAERAGEVPFPDPGQDPAGYLTAYYSHPPWLVARWLARYGYQETEALCRADNEPPQPNLRANRLVTSRDRLAVALAQEGIVTAPCLLAPDCLAVVEGGGRLRGTAAWRQGAFTIQGQGSMLAGYLASPMPGWQVADLCAGTGGKATHLAELMEGRGTVLAYDRSARRIQALQQEARRLGLTIQAEVADATGLPASGRLDLALVDAPCSGTGTLRRRPDLRWHRCEGELGRLVALQGALLSAAAGLLHKGGHLIYTTCSLEPEENEGVVASFLESHPGYRAQDCREALPFLPADVFAISGESLHLLPHRHGTDGMFMAALRKVAAGPQEGGR